MNLRLFVLAPLFLATVAWPLAGLTADEPAAAWAAGLSKIEITPPEPVRLSGYGNRNAPHVGVDTPLFVRCLAIRNDDAQQPAAIHVLLSIDLIGMPAKITKEVTDHVSQKYGIPRQQIVLSFTHTHTGPDLVGGLNNLYAQPLSPAELEAGTRYRDHLMAAIKNAIGEAITSLQPASLAFSRGSVDFAVNRRVLVDSKWSGFGNQANGPIDHGVEVLRISNESGKTLGVLFNYACHCTSIDPSANRVNHDWAGYAATEIEQQCDDAVALCLIGSGGDANPEPRGTAEMAMVHGRELGAEVIRVLTTELSPITKKIDARFDYASLEFELPTIEELRSRLDDPAAQTRRHAEHWIEVYKDEGRLPASYPVPIQAWRFGDQLTLVFLGGEVVIDYTIRLRKELPEENLWVTAYANDVMGYVCSERMRSEGGYEFDQSAIFYNLPGPWAAGTEDRLIERLKALVTKGGRPQAVPAEQTISRFKLTEGYRIELMAAEPLVVDPINIAFGSDGRLWVVEMGDYPAGVDGQPSGAGNIKVLSDSDGDGVFDKADVFISDLEFPTGVFPWRDGVLVTSAPDVFFARDSDGDGVADQREILYSDFALANPQHRINGFTYALDHSLHLASGDNLGMLLCNRTGKQVDASGSDVQIFPDSGELTLVNGRTQYIRSSNVWGEWFGSDNSRPMYAYPIDQRYAAWNPHITHASHSKQLFEPAVAPAVFPIREASERFNDTYAANRFTSACSSIVVGKPFGSDDADAAIVCEPVHNLVHRSYLVPDGSSYQAVRGDAELSSEFLASGDPWFRPVRAIEGPDGCLWIVDMYRESIEHPEWIPQAWREQLDLRAGSDRGRIYRVVPEGLTLAALPAIADLDAKQLVAELRQSSRARREQSHQRLVEVCDTESWEPIVADLERLLTDSTHPETKIHAIHLLNIAGRLETGHLQILLKSNHFGCQTVGVELSESRLDAVGGTLDQALLAEICHLADSADPRVRMRVALALSRIVDQQAAAAYAAICELPMDSWTATAVSLGLPRHWRAVGDVLTQRLLDPSQTFSDIDEQLLTHTFITMRAIGIDVAKYVGDRVAAGDPAASFRLAAIFAASHDSAGVEENVQLVSLYEQALPVIADREQNLKQRCRALTLVGIGLGSVDRERDLLLSLLSAETPLEVQLMALERIAKIDRPKFVDHVLKRWDHLSQTLRDTAAGLFVTRSLWQKQFVSALEDGVIGMDDLSPAIRQQLRLTGSRSLQVRVERLLGSAHSSKGQLIQSYLSEMNHGGDPQAGAALFRQHCSVCHLGTAGGTPVGASLENLTNRSDQHLVQSILDPNSAVDPKYQTYLIQTLEGTVLSGVIEEESSDRIIIASADGKRTVVRRDEIEEMKNSGVSLMPEGFEQQLNHQQMKDLIRYIEQLGVANR